MGCWKFTVTSLKSYGNFDHGNRYNKIGFEYFNF